MFYPTTFTIPFQLIMVTHYSQGRQRNRYIKKIGEIRSPKKLIFRAWMINNTPNLHKTPQLFTLHDLTIDHVFTSTTVITIVTTMSNGVNNDCKTISLLQRKYLFLRELTYLIVTTYMKIQGQNGSSQQDLPT